MVGFDDLLAEANQALRTFKNGLATCLRAARQRAIQNAFSTAVNAATTPRQILRARQASSSAYLLFARDGKDPRQRLVSFEQALNHSASAELLASSKHFDISPAAAVPLEYILLARYLIIDLSLDLNAALSFWARANRAAGDSVRLLGELSAFQAEWLLEHGARCVAAGADYKTGLRCGHEATAPAETALQCARKLADQKLLQFLPKLQEDIHVFIDCTCRSTQARVQADCLLATFGNRPDEEQLWQVVDKYTHALRQTNEQDLLSECRTHARLGLVFARHLKLRDKATLHCKRAVQLAHTVRPRPVGHDWFEEAEAMLRQIQREQEAEVQAAQALQEDNILKALEPELKRIEAAKKKSARDLLTYLKNNHPAKFKSKQPEPAHDEIKLALRKASIENHPDKQQMYDKKWQTLAREISKAINEVWADYKG